METLEDSHPGGTPDLVAVQGSLVFLSPEGSEPPLVGWLAAREAQLAVSPPPS